MYEIVGTLRSRAFRIVWMLEELEEPYTLSPEAPRSDRVRALNPSGKIPVLLDGDAALTDSTAILTYLADKHGRFTAPAGTLDRARQDAMLHRVLDEIESLVWTAARHSFILPEDKRVPEVKDSLKWEFAQNIARIGEAIEGPYLMGEAFTVPDIVFGHLIRWARFAKFPDAPDPVVDYLRHIKARPAFARTTERAA